MFWLVCKHSDNSDSNSCQTSHQQSSGKTHHHQDRQIYDEAKDSDEVVQHNVIKNGQNGETALNLSKYNNSKYGTIEDIQPRQSDGVNSNHTEGEIKSYLETYKEILSTPEIILLLIFQCKLLLLG